MHLSLHRPALSAYPLWMSAAAALLVLGHALLYGRAPEPDEGAAAHLFQLLMVLQLPLMAALVFRDIRRPASFPAQKLLPVVLAWAGAALMAALLT